MTIILQFWKGIKLIAAGKDTAPVLRSSEKGDEARRPMIGGWMTCCSFI
jgi:hypothetical protein